MQKNGDGAAHIDLPGSAEGAAAWELLDKLLVVLASGEQPALSCERIANLIGVAREAMEKRPGRSTAASLLLERETFWEEMAARTKEPG